LRSLCIYMESLRKPLSTTNVLKCSIEQSEQRNLRFKAFVRPNGP